MDTITLSGMRFEGRVGATDEERAFPQLLEADLVIEADLAAAAAADDLSETVDYAALVALTEHTIEASSFRLLEALAGALAAAVLDASSRIAAVTVRVRKLAVPLEVDMDHAQVEIRRSR